MISLTNLKKKETTPVKKVKRIILSIILHKQLKIIDFMFNIKQYCTSLNNINFIYNTKQH